MTLSYCYDTLANVLAFFASCVILIRFSYMKTLNKNQGNNKAWWQPALVIFAKMSGWIFFPVVVGLFLGRWLDDKFNTAPWFFLSVIGFAFVISIIGIIKTAKEEFKHIEEEEKRKKEKREDEQ